MTVVVRETKTSEACTGFWKGGIQPLKKALTFRLGRCPALQPDG